MHLEGSCHCRAVQFSCTSYAPVPYLRCYCSICRKTGGGGGYAINIGASAGSLKVDGENALSVYSAMIDGKQSPAERRFCKNCGSALWAWDPRWPELIHPFASAIDTPLPVPPKNVHIMLEFKPDWVVVPDGEGENYHAAYPTESLKDWHARHGLLAGAEPEGR